MPDPALQGNDGLTLRSLGRQVSTTIAARDTSAEPAGGTSTSRSVPGRGANGSARWWRRTAVRPTPRAGEAPINNRLEWVCRERSHFVTSLSSFTSICRSIGTYRRDDRTRWLGTILDAFENVHHRVRLALSTMGLLLTMSSVKTHQLSALTPDSSVRLASSKASDRWRNRHV